MVSRSVKKVALVICSWAIKTKKRKRSGRPSVLGHQGSLSSKSCETLGLVHSVISSRDSKREYTHNMNEKENEVVDWKRRSPFSLDLYRQRDSHILLTV